jgi:hypothetical protein
MRSFALAFAMLASALAQTTPPHGVRITFLPPPLDGTLSVGVYSAEGKLIRTLFREATDEAFTAGLNGFITHWDGRDDAGKTAPAGKYFVRGYAVGEVVIEGVAFHGNDWLGEDEEAPRVAALKLLSLNARELGLVGSSPGGGLVSVRVNFDPLFTKIVPADAAATVEPATSAPGRDGSKWEITTDEDAGVAMKVVRQSSAGGEILRQLECVQNEPQPFALAAATDRDEIYLLERDASQTRLRGLRLRETKAEADGMTVSEWEVFLSRSIHAQESFTQIAPLLGRAAPRPEEKIRVALMPNELLPVAPAAVQLTVAIDEQGSFLRSADGLPLRRITGTPHLKWATLAREADGSVSLFQSDGAVTEEFRLRKLDQMMAFDAGEYDWTGAK